MGRIMAIDYGLRRTGIAVTDTLQIIANGLTTVDTNLLLPFIADYLKKEEVERFVVGQPKQMNNEPSESMKAITLFVDKLQKQYPAIPVAYMDERFTSVLAHKAMLDGGMKKMRRREKAIVDEISAVIILQSYLEKTKYQYRR